MLVQQGRRGHISRNDQKVMSAGHGHYWMWWLFQLSEELDKAMRRESRGPGKAHIQRVEVTESTAGLGA